MTFRPDGDPTGGADDWAGSLFVSGHDRLPYGELPNGGQIAEVSIPQPAIASDPALLPQAQFIQTFHDVTSGLFGGLDEIPRLGLQYLNHAATGARVHITWGQHFQEDVATQRPSQALFSPDLASPATAGAWFIGGASLYSVNDYMLEIPAEWASAHSGGRVLGTGRFRDGGWSGKGPALSAYVPWLDAAGTLPLAGATVSGTTLLLYEGSDTNEDVTHHALAGYQHPDEWAGGAWITASSGRSAVAVVGNKGTGAKYWYGWVNPAGPDHPCVETELLGQFTLCWTSGGTPCPPADLVGCTGHNDSRGWWSSAFRGQILLYDPEDLAAVASGTQASWEPQPYATFDLEPFMFGNPSGVETDMLGTGVQRRFKIGAVAYDRQRNALFVLELFADGVKPVVHVFTVEAEAPPVSTRFHAVTPCRLVDTRNPSGPLGGPALLGQAAARAFVAVGSCAVPSTARSLSANVTVTQPTAAGHLTLFRAASSLPVVSTVNFIPGQTRANNAVVPLDSSGRFAVFDGQATGQTAHLIVDVNGYFE